MKRILFSTAVWLILLVAAKPGFGQVQRALLSIEGLSIPTDGALYAFHIETWGVTPLAVCKVFPLWDIKAEKFMDPEGLLSGRSDPYHRTLTKLDQLYLVDVYSYQPLPKGDPKSEYHPASFAGWYEVFDGDGNVIKKRHRLHAVDFHLTPAARCPDPPPSEP